MPFGTLRIAKPLAVTKTNNKKSNIYNHSLSYRCYRGFPRF